MRTIVLFHVSLIAASSIAAVLVAVFTSAGSSGDRAMFIGLIWWAQLVSLLLCAARTDLRSHRIPNQLTYTSIVGSLVLHSLGVIDSSLQCTLGPPGDALLGGAMCGLLMGSLWVMRAIGGGDVKLMVAVGLLLGFQAGLTALLLAHLIAGVSVVVGLAIQQFAPHPIVRCAAFLPALVHHPLQAEQPSATARKRIPMAGFYAAGVLTACLYKMLGT